MIRLTVMRQLGRVAHEIVLWQRETFPDQDVPSTVAHLRDEVEKELGDGETIDAHEIADCIFLLLAIADRSGIDLVAALESKLVINKKRSWERLSDGSHRHIEGT